MKDQDMEEADGKNEGVYSVNDNILCTAVVGESTERATSRDRHVEVKTR